MNAVLMSQCLVDGLLLNREEMKKLVMFAIISGTMTA